MSLLTRITSAFAAFRGKSVAYQGGGAFHPYVDRYRVAPTPDARMLVHELLDTAYACATLNADLVASTPMRLYVRKKRRGRTSRLVTRGHTRPVTKSARDWLAKASSSSQQMRNAEDVEEVVSHPALDLLASPNQTAADDGIGLSQYDLLALSQLYLESVGRAYWYCPRDGIGETPSAIWVLAPQFVTPMVYPNDEQAVRQYLFNGGGGIQQIAPREMIPLRLPDVTSPYLGGMSPLRACFETVYLFRLFNAETIALLNNGGKPSGVWSPKGDESGGSIGEKEAERVREMFRESFRQAGRGGLLVTEHPGQITPLGWPTQEIVSPEVMQQAMNRVANCFQVPTTKLSRGDSNRASAETGDYAHAKDAGLPRLMRLASTLNAYLLPMYDDPDGLLFFAPDSPVPEDRAFITTAMKDGVTIGAVSRNEYREAVGLPPAEWGDTPLAPSSSVAVDPVTGEPKPSALLSGLFGQQQTQQQPTDTPPSPEASPTASALNGAQVSAATAIVAQVAAGEIPRDSGIAQLQQFFGLTPEQAEAVMGSAGTGAATQPNINPAAQQAQQANIVPPPEPQKSVKGRKVWIGEQGANGLARALPQGREIAQAMRGAFAQQRVEVLGEVTKSIIDVVTKDEAKPDVSRLPSRFTPLSKWTQKMANEVKPMIEVIARNEGRAMLARVGASPDVFAVFEQRIPEAASKLTLKFCEETNATTTQKLDDALASLRQEIADGIFDGDTREELTERVNVIFDEAEQSRAAVIATTEASRASHQGELLSAKATGGAVTKKAWLLSADACPICQGIATATAGGIPLDATFAELGGDYGSIDSPPSHPNCQCSLTYQVESR